MHLQNNNWLRMHLELFKPSDKKFDVAFSGGVDSTCLLMYTKQYVNKQVRALYVNHGDQYSTVEQEHVRSVCQQLNIELLEYRPHRLQNPGESLEAYWRDVRYHHFDSHELRVAVGHHLDDVCETYLFSTLHGNPKLIEYQRGNAIRPLLMHEKQTLVEWCNKYKYPYLQDTNKFVADRPRTKVRNTLIPAALEVHKGFKSTVRGMLQKKRIMCP